MPKTLEQFIEEAKKEFRELMDNPIAFDEGGCLRYDEKALLVFIEFKIQEAYRAGAEGMRDAIRNIDISDPSLKTAMLNKVSGQAKAFLATLNPSNL